MAIAPGSRFGSYEVTAPLGEGGMGVVLRGRDSRLQRDVALKLLPDNFASDPERLARFQREAQVLASLNHPNIAQVYGLEHVEGSSCIVMELVEGETIADKLKRGPFSFDEAIEVARQIADALAAAHERGIVHRDLKPANIKITPNGTVKVLDFGLAKAVGPKTSNPSLTSMPTAADGSVIGSIVGTPGYMSPEQARGKEVDSRTDIWAFGCVLFEMLTAHRAFEGETATDIIAKIVTSPPDLNLLPKQTSPSIRMLLSSLLNKNASQRLQHIGDVRLFLDGTLGATTPAKSEPVPLSHPLRGKLVIAALALVFAIVAVPAVLYFLKSEKPAPQMRFDLSIPGISGSPTISPDGRTLAYLVQPTDGKRTLWIRPVGSDVGQQLSGTEDVNGSVWSPDSKSLAFIVDGNLKKIDLAGGSQSLIGTVGSTRGADWNRSGTILLARTSTNIIEQISESGGKITAVTSLDAGRKEGLQALPVFLPDGNHFLYVSVAAKTEDSGIFMSSLDAGTKPTQLSAFVPNRFNGMYYVSPGILIYSNEGRVIAQRLDKQGSKLQGSPVVLAQDIDGSISVSNTGLLIYHKSSPVAGKQLRWFDHDGKPGNEAGPVRDYGNVDLSPKGDRAAVDMVVENNRDIWVIDLARSVPSRITFNPGQDWSPAWSPDGQRLAFATSRAEYNSVTTIVEKSATGAGKESKMDTGGANSIPVHWSPDDRHIVFSRTRTGPGFDNWILPLFGDRKPAPYLESTFDRIQSRVSPDSRFLAYATNESGTFQIVVQTFPDPNGGKWQISADGGVEPKWRHDGHELYYVSLDGKMMSVPITLGPSLTAGRPATLFQTPLTVNRASPTRDRRYDIAPDGRFLMSVPASGAAYIPFTVVVNWQSALEK